jgi:hypothetical protein
MKTDDFDHSVGILQSPKTLDELTVLLLDLVVAIKRGKWPNAGAVIHGNGLEISLDGKWDSR